MIGGLVEEEQLRIADQRPGEEHPPLQAGGEGVGIGVGRELEAIDHGAHPVLQVPASGRHDRRLQRLEHRRVAPPGGHRGALPVVLGDPRPGLAETAGHLVVDARRQPLRHALGQPRHAQPGGTRHLALVGLQLAGDEPHQRRLAGAVAPHQRQALPLLDGEVGTGEQRWTAQGEVDVTQDDEGHGSAGGDRRVGNHGQ